MFAEREPWRHDAEVACLKSGSVRERAGLVRIEPIDGPGICGADFPLKVAVLGDTAALGYTDNPPRPPGIIPGASEPESYAFLDQLPLSSIARYAAVRTLKKLRR
jgi:hypothetical protein